MFALLRCVWLDFGYGGGSVVRAYQGTKKECKVEHRKPDEDEAEAED